MPGLTRPPATTPVLCALSLAVLMAAVPGFVSLFYTFTLNNGKPHGHSLLEEGEQDA